MENAESLTFGELVKTFRQRAGLTQVEFAARLEKSRRSIIDWEQGTSRPQTKGDLQDIARVAQLNEEETVRLLKAGGQDPSPRIWTIDYPRNPYFTGREAILAQIAQELRTSHPPVVPLPFALSGLGGIGKTQIALEYAYRFYQQYQAVLWIEASSPDRWIASYIALAAVLDLPEKDLQEHDEVVLAVKRWLQSQSRWLLILDDIEDLSLMREFLPSLRKGHILLTTRSQAMGGLAHALEIEALEEQQSLLFFLRRASLLPSGAVLEKAETTNLSYARTICEELGWLPLALDQAGAYIEETQCGLLQYLQLYQAHRAMLLQRRGGLAADHPDPVSTTWSLSFEKIEQRSPAAADLLRVCAFLHPEAIPEELLLEMISNLTLFNCPSLLEVAEDPLLLGEIIHILRSYSFLHRRGSERLLTIHRLVQAVLKDAMERDEYQWWVKQMVAAMGLAFPDGHFDAWPKCERFLPHALACVRLAEQEQMGGLEKILIIYQTGMYLLNRLRLNEAEPLLQRAFAICEGELGASDPLTAHSLTNLASLYQFQGKYDLAESVFQRALTLFETELEADDPLIIDTLDNFAALYRIQEKYTLALPLLWKVYFLSLQAFGPSHMSVARCLSGLSGLHLGLEELDEAEAFSLQALFLSEQLVGPEAPYVAVCLSNLSVIYMKQKKFVEAEPLLLRALSLCEKMHDPDGSLAVKCLAHLAEVYHMQGKESQAEPLFHQAVAMQEQLLGEGHPEVAFVLAMQAECYIDQGELARAEPLLRRVVTLEEQLGSVHPKRLRHLKFYTALLLQMGQEEAAQKILEQARYIFERTSTEKLSQQQETSDTLSFTSYEVFLTLDHVWKLCETALKKQLTQQEQATVEQTKQTFWLWLGNLENQSKPGNVPKESDEKGRELIALLSQPPFLDLEERPDLRHVPGLGYVPDDFPFESYEEMVASSFWSEYTFHGFLAYARFLVLLRYYTNRPLSADDQMALSMLQEAITAWKRHELEGPLPEVPVTGPSEVTMHVSAILDQNLFSEKAEEIFELPDQEVLRLLHPDDIPHLDDFRMAMAQRFETVKSQLIEDLKKMGKLPL